MSIHEHSAELRFQMDRREIDDMNFVIQALTQSLFGALAAFFSTIFALILGLPTTGTGL